MRLTLASAFLADSLSRVSSLELHGRAIELLSRNPTEDAQLDNSADIHKEHPLLEELQQLRKNHRVTPRIQSLLSKLSSNDEQSGTSQLTNVNTATKIECHPHHHHSDAIAADIGILSCGNNRYCMESSNSSLGGYCVEMEEHERQLQTNATALDAFKVVCNLAENSVDLNCETCTTDEAAYTGEFQCIYTSDCVPVPGLCGDGKTFNFCGTDNLKGIVNGPDYYHRESCFDITSPIPFSYCDSITIQGETLSCIQSINGVNCNTCELYINSQTGSICQKFDCTNTDLGVEGNDCTIPLVGALAFGYLYQTLPCSNGCSLCGPGRLMSTSTNNFVNDNGESVNCFGYQMNALTGDFAGNDFCQTLTDNVEGPCGCIDDPTPNTGGNNAGSSPISTLSSSVMALALTGASLLVAEFCGF